MPINCPLGKDSHSCWWCLFGSNNQPVPTNKICNHPDYGKPKSYKVKPRKIKNKKMKIVIDKITGGYISIKTIDKGEQILFEMFKDKEKK